MEIGTFKMDREGNVTPATDEEARAFIDDMEACHVAHSVTVNGDEVSTVFIPFCLLEDGIAKCFESKLIRANGSGKVVAQYTSFAEAIKGHDLVVQQLRGL